MTQPDDDLIDPASAAKPHEPPADPTQELLRSVRALEVDPPAPARDGLEPPPQSGRDGDDGL